MSAEHRVAVPGDKSLSHRALLFAALAEGTSRLENVQRGDDVRSTAAALRALGCVVPDPAGARGGLMIEGLGISGFTAPGKPLDCGNSGTTARLLLGMLAAAPFRTVVSGDASLHARPMRRVTEPLRLMGARIEELGEPGRLPLAITGGRLRPLDHDSPIASGQVKSALLLAGLVGRVPVRVTEPVRSRDHTERLLEAMGVTLRVGEREGRAEVAIEPAERLLPLDFRVPGDFSAAAFLLVYALLAGDRGLRIARVGLNPGRTGLLRALARMGARIRTEDPHESAGEPAGDLIAGPCSLHATTIDASELPSMIDEVPALAIAAARAEGETVIAGAAELRVKESDRIRSLVQNLRAVGAHAEELPDGLVVRGSEHRLAGLVRARGDHRIAMAFGVLGALPGNDIVVDEPTIASVSFPGFWDALRSCSARGAGS